MSKKSMFDVKPVEPRVFLRSRTGDTFVYDSYLQFLSILRTDIIDYLGVHFSVMIKTPTFYHYGGQWILPREPGYVAEYNGIILKPEKVRADWRDYLERTRVVNRNNWFYRINNRIFKYRYDPVPLTGVRHWHRGCGIRSFKTTQERRWSLSAKEDGIKWRGKRSFRYLPNSWDDIPRRSTDNNNWKRFRKTQWREDGNKTSNHYS